MTATRTIRFNTGRKYTSAGQLIVATLHADGIVTFFDHSRMVDGQYTCQLPFAFSAEQVMRHYDSNDCAGSARSWADGTLHEGCNASAKA